MAKDNRIYVVGEKIFVTSNNGLSWDTRSVPEGSCVNQLVSQGTRLYATQPCKFGSLWVSDDDGKNWQIVAPNKLPTEVYAIHFWKSQIFAGTSKGLYVSNDNGATWNLKPFSTNIATLPVTHIRSLGDKVHATVEFNLSEKTAYAYSSSDGGETWQEERDYDGRFHSFDSLQVYISQYNGLEISSDGGATWRIIKAPSTLPDTSFHGLGLFENTLYLLHKEGISLTKDGGISWSSTRSVPFFNTEYPDSLSISQSAWFLPTYRLGLFISKDKGQSWTGKTELVAGTPARIRSGAIDGLRLLMASAEGLYISENLGATWMLKKQSDGLPSNSIYKVKKRASKYYLATNNGFAVSKDGASTWTLLRPSPDGSLTGSDITESDGVIYAAVYNNFGLSKDQGQNWKFEERIGIWETVHDICCVEAVDKTVFVGTDKGLYLSKDGGLTWEKFAIGNVRAIELNNSTAYIATGTSLLVYNPSIPIR